MLKDIEMVVFDMAGTTINEQNVVYKTLLKAIVDYGIDTNLETVLEYGAGKEKHQAIIDILTHLKSNKVNESSVIFEDFKILLHKVYEELEVTSIDGVEELLLLLRNKNIKVVLNTGYSSNVASALLEKIGWKKEEHYDLLVTASDVKNGRPHPEMIHKAMEHFTINNAKNVLKAGDSAIDIEEGKNANCGITIGVLSGAQTREQLATMTPDFIIDSLACLKLHIID